MNKQEFLTRLRKELAGLPQDDTEERISFYSEMIDDRIEDGLSEEDAVNAVGSIDEIVSQIVADTPFSKIAKERMRPKRKLGAFEITLLVLGSPLWLTLLLTAIFVLLTVYVVLWTVAISLWAIFGAIIGCAFGGIVSGIVILITSNAITGIMTIGAGLVCAGIAILIYFICIGATKLIAISSKKVAVRVKKLFIKKREEEKR